MKAEKLALKNTKAADYTYRFYSSRKPEEIFETLLNVRKWWYGLYEEEITGSSQKTGDEFSFRAGNGAHFTRQRLSTLTPNKKIEWEVLESHLSFVKKPDEWTGTKFSFECNPSGKKTEVTFIHKGLTEQAECYTGCSDAWTRYLKKLETSLR